MPLKTIPRLGCSGISTLGASQQCVPDSRDLPSPESNLSVLSVPGNGVSVQTGCWGAKSTWQQEDPNPLQLPAHPSPVATSKQPSETTGETTVVQVQEHMQVTAVTKPGCSGQTCNGFLVPSTNAFLASSQCDGTYRSQANFFMSTRLTDLLLCMAFLPSLELFLPSTQSPSMPGVHHGCQCYTPIPRSPLPSCFPSFVLPARSPHCLLSRGLAKHRAWLLSLCLSFTWRISSLSGSFFFLPILIEVRSFWSCPMEEANRQGKGGGEPLHKKPPMSPVLIGNQAKK